MANRGPTHDAEAIAKACLSETVEDVAKRFGCSETLVRKHCKLHGVNFVTRSMKEREAIAIWVRDNKATVDDAVKHFQTSRRRVKRILLENGVVARDKEFVTPVPRSNFEILACMMQGSRDTDIANEFCVSKQRVEQIRRAAERAGIIGDDPDFDIQVKR